MYVSILHVRQLSSQMLMLHFIKATTI